MLQINLKPGAKRKRARGPRFSFSLRGLLDRLSGLRKVSDPLLAGALGAWVVVGAVMGWFWVTTSAKLFVLEPRLEDVRAEHQRFKALIAQKRKAEQIRDSLVRQLNVIRDVDGDRYVWPHLLDEVAKALPPYTWLTEVAVVVPDAPPPAPAPAGGAAADKKSAPADTVVVKPPVGVRIVGRTVDIQAYTRFMRQLEASPWIADVTTVSAQTVIEADRPVTAFTVRVVFTKADSAYIRTVPLNAKMAK